jgi:glycosyltransferase involved in cell wall biosynthesis
MNSDFMKQVCIGIPCREQPEQLRETLESLRRHSPATVELLLLPDGPDARMRQALRGVDILQSGTDQPSGTAACFNRLAAVSSADVLILLESGSQVGPGWLEHLTAALASDPRNGLVGPTTNKCWNEQGVFPLGGNSIEQVAATAREAARRFGDQARTLEPLYSLADFCYVVRREVIEAIGAADESYKLGPCWEMDYNIRAARAGWRGVWAGAAYVHRTPFSTRRRSEEARYFEASKRHYQDKFCGARLRGEKNNYRSHCRGDACANFAPAALIKVKQESERHTGTAGAPPAVTRKHDPRAALRKVVTVATPKPLATSTVEAVSPPVVQIDSAPLVTCIMPTYNRRSFVPQAIRCFLRQDYPNLELLVVDDGTDAVVDCVPESARIRYLRLNQKMTIGAKRNFAVEKARGEFIVHWDDDDWYPSSRVSTQIAALSERGSDICGSSQVSFYNATTDQAWEYRYAARGAAWVAGATLAYRRSFWQRNKFPNIQVGEDSRFVWSSASKRICDLRQPTLCIATVHAGNTSRKETGGVYWHRIPSEPLRSLLGDEVHFYRPVDPSWPLVSCIMPTFNRRAFVPHALEYFLHQDYPNRELIIVDDGADAVGDLAANLPGVRYIRLPSRKSIGAKRNLACQQARGEIIATWDDDDWYSPDRLRYQVMPIIAGQADLTGLENAFVLELSTGDFWTTNPQLHAKLFAGNVHGGTIVYRKDLLAKGLRYPEVNLAEDAYLLRCATKRGLRLVRLSNPGVFVYMRHGRNAWREFAPGRFISPAGWQKISAPLAFPPAALAAYKAAAAQF